ncbi:hypothetical protein GGR21_001385 [Dysgonomonas hofstadii]|uniref:Beta-galactosidase trimerisation domain-containing protein n=1 Tax=Dysgonomonas hofstadii TaxID=637886 RepID=A0A840CSH8_9BACT|nr:hypothetical protein [Dysgonomonas hofstadii]MBB4035492.1 hypothetical protein [Dysgonomonas hofstadii]
MMKKTFIICLLAIGLPLGAQIPDKVKTTFQTSREWRPTIDNRADAVMIYGVGGNPSDKSKRIPFEERVKSWRDRGYITHFMTGIAWGEYQDYFTGEWDGKWHLDEGQVTQAGDTLWHGRLVPYLVPSKNFLNYLKEKHIKRVIDAGIGAIFMEEPEFWARAGYSDAFKKEWQEYYGFPWRAQHESPENTWLANKLKYELYYRALDDVFTYAKEYGKSKGMDVKCYVPTHSLVNYSQWQIVSPEASLASLPCVDGYIAQVWTGTSREPNYYNGIKKERVFETAFLEYGSMESMTAPTGRKMFFLTDPIEDWPRDWEDYRRNYQATFTAQLLYPNMANYEIMPWPERIYEGLYSVSKGSKEKARIPKDYSTQMQVMINTLNDMPVSNNKVSGSAGISVLMGNSLMFQRFPTHDGYDDPQLANFYGLVLPFLKKGIPVNIAHIENLEYTGTLKDTKILLMTYSNMKPLGKNAHDHLAKWIKEGGLLIYNGRDNDPFQTVREWWNLDGMDYPTASAHLFEKLGLGASPAEGKYKVGKGTVHIIRQDPKEYVLSAGGDAKLIEVTKKLYENVAKAGTLHFKNNFHLTRGNYELISVVDESVSDGIFTIKGLFIDLFDPLLPILTEKTVQPGNQSMLFNIKSVKDKKNPQVLATAARISEEKRAKNLYSFIAKSPVETTNIMRILLPNRPQKCIITNPDGSLLATATWEWDKNSNTTLIKFENNPDGISVEIIY